MGITASNLVSSSLDHISERNVTVFDIFAIAFSLTATCIYHGYLYAYAHSLNPSVRLSINIIHGHNWILKHSIKGDSQSVTLAVQTLRNNMIVAVLLGGSSLQLAFGYVNGYSSQLPPLERTRYAILVIVLFASFICWATVIRLASHLSFLLGTLDTTQFNNSPYYHELKENIPEVPKSPATESTHLLDSASTPQNASLYEANRMMTTMLISFRYITSYPT